MVKPANLTNAQKADLAYEVMPLHRQHCSPHLTLRVVEGDPATTEMQV